MGGVLAVLAGAVVMLGAFLPLNETKVALGQVVGVTIARNSFQLGSGLSDNGYGFILLIFAVGSIVLGAGLLGAFDASRARPTGQLAFAASGCVIVYSSATSDKISAPGIHFSLGIGCFVCWAGLLMLAASAYQRMPKKLVAINGSGVIGNEGA
jgi:hypothetical protein